MAFLVTGGTSKVGTVVARLLKDDGKKVIISSRSGRAPDGYEATKLDWADISTIDTPFISDEPIQGVYIMAPPGLSASETIVPFIDKAVAHGVKRFVLLSGSAVEKESDFGKVWKYLDDQKLDYFVLRPTAFTDNFHQFDGASIRESSQFTTAMPNAKIPFISAVDIGELAFRALTNEKNERSDQCVIGPELLTYDQAAEVLSNVLGRKITHNIITGEQMSQLYTEVLGIPLQTATFLVKAQLDMDAGSAERLWGNSEVFVGKETLKVWAERNKSKLAPALNV